MWDWAGWKRTVSILCAGSLLPPSGSEASKVSIHREDQAGYKELLSFAGIAVWI